MGSEGPCFGDGLIFPFKIPSSTNPKSKILKIFYYFKHLPPPIFIPWLKESLARFGKKRAEIKEKQGWIDQNLHLSINHEICNFW